VIFDVLGDVVCGGFAAPLQHAQRGEQKAGVVDDASILAIAWHNRAVEQEHLSVTDITMLDEALKSYGQAVAVAERVTDCVLVALLVAVALRVAVPVIDALRDAAAEKLLELDPVAEPVAVALLVAVAVGVGTGQES
jgi:light-independent protochlorophyllide reductase subunit L